LNATPHRTDLSSDKNNRSDSDENRERVRLLSAAEIGTDPVTVIWLGFGDGSKILLIFSAACCR